MTVSSATWSDCCADIWPTQRPAPSKLTFERPLTIAAWVILPISLVPHPAHGPASFSLFSITEGEHDNGGDDEEYDDGSDVGDGGDGDGNDDDGR